MSPRPQPQKVSVPSTLPRITKHWSPKLVASLNDAYDIKVAKIAGEYIWHSHAETDELFYVLSGDMTIKLREPGREGEGVDGVDLSAGAVFVVPKGMRHCPVTRAGEEVAIMLIETKGVLNSGDAPRTEGLTNEVEDFRGQN